jgi:polysaccharide transporter, PST family
MKDKPTPTSLAHARQGFRAALLSQALRVGCKAVSVVALARLVSPDEHGRFAMAASVFYVVVLFRDGGLGTAALQARELSEEQCSTLWRAHVWMGFALAAITLALSPAIAAFYREPRVAGVLALLSASLLLLGLNAWPRVLLARALRFTELNRLETIGAFAGTAAMIGSAALGAGAYAFVIFALVSEGVVLVEALRLSRWRPQAAARWESLRSLWRTGADLTGYNILQSILLQVDTLLLGRWFGAAALGFYSRPNQLVALPLQHIGWPLTHVMLATLARNENHPAESARHVRSTANLIAHLALPFAAICVALPHEIVALVLGPSWSEAAPLLRWLALGAAMSYLGVTTFGVCVAAHRTGRLAVLSAVSLVITIAALWLGRPHGPEGLAAGVALAQAVVLIPRIWWSTRGTAVRAHDYAMAFFGPVTLGIVFGLGCFAGVLATRDMNLWIRLSASLTAGGIGSAALVGVWPALQRELTDVWRHRPGASSLNVAASETAPPNSAL